MGRKLNLLSGIGLGAVLTYLIDPERGRRRRALVRDKAVRLWHEAGRSVAGVSRDLGNRLRGVTAETISGFGREQVSDDVLVERVRSAMGHAVSHPSAIDVTASDGRVTLKGPVLVWEVDRLLSRVGGVRGVREIEDLLEMHESAKDMPGLEGSAAEGEEEA